MQKKISSKIVLLSIIVTMLITTSVQANTYPDVRALLVNGYSYYIVDVQLGNTVVLVTSTCSDMRYFPSWDTSGTTKYSNLKFYGTIKRYILTNGTWSYWDIYYPIGTMGINKLVAGNFNIYNQSDGLLFWEYPKPATSIDLSALKLNTIDTTKLKTIGLEGKTVIVQYKNSTIQYTVNKESKVTNLKILN